MHLYELFLYLLHWNILTQLLKIVQKFTNRKENQQMSNFSV